MNRRLLPRLLGSINAVALIVGGISCASAESPTAAGPESYQRDSVAPVSTDAEAGEADRMAPTDAPAPEPDAAGAKDDGDVASGPAPTTPSPVATLAVTGTTARLEASDAKKNQAKAEARQQAQASAKSKSEEASRNAGAVASMIVSSEAPPPPAPDPTSVQDKTTVNEGGTFVHAGTNPFIVTANDALSTFSIDVDTGSFTFARRFLKSGQLPPDSAVRVEEWVNAMHYQYAGPTKAQAMPFAVHVDGAPSPIAKGKHLVRVALQGKKVSRAERQATHLVFLVDVSGSMEAHDKLPLAREAMHMMVDELRDDDSIALVTYAGATGVVLPSTKVSNKRAIHKAIDNLNSGGGTNMGSGMELAYREAAKELGGGRSARVIVLSDGDANIGRTSHQTILSSVKGYVSEGVMMSTVGFGTGNYNDHLMEQLADAGNGNYTYIDSKKSAERFFVDELDGTLETIAQDVKIQVEWNPASVARYRLVGYENRDIADKDFRNDKKDAGEIGAGHAVTALYEVELTSPSPSEALGTVRIRAKKPRGTKADEFATAIPATMLKERPGDLDHDAQTAAAVALAAEILRGSPYAEGRSLAEAAALLREAATGPWAEERLELARELMKVEPRLARR